MENEEQTPDPKLKRQKRFQQKERSRSRWKRVATRWAAERGEQDKYHWIERITGMLSNHGKLCSCTMCGNARKYWKRVSFQEEKANESFKSEMKDL